MRDMFGLGEREATIMELLWSVAEPVTVRDVLDRLERPLAYTTVMTVLDNLHNKGHVTREKVGRAFQYRAAETREAAAARMVREVLAASGDAEGALTLRRGYLARGINGAAQDSSPRRAGMTVALVLMAGAALIGVAGPACLRPTVRPSLLPAAALAAWLGALLAFLVLTTLSATLLLFPHVLDTSGVRTLVGGCLSGTVPHSSFGTLVQLGISLLPLTILARVAVVAIRSLRCARRCRARHFWMLQAATCRSGEVH